PLQQAWIDVQVPDCGYCQNGMLIRAADLLSRTKNPTEDQIRDGMNGHLCRCGTYPRILSAIKQAAAMIARGGNFDGVLLAPAIAAASTGDMEEKAIPGGDRVSDWDSWRASITNFVHEKEFSRKTFLKGS